ncbi:MAG: flavodoxin family protein [Clostridium sp.]|nr:flavodoxin family protein [Clostridium sp.]
MKILVLEGSPHKKGSSNLLANNFIKGATESGHEVQAYDVAHAKIGACMGCNACGMNGECIQKDDMVEIEKLILNSDMIVFVSPIYYFGISAQLKTVIDRFYSFNTKLMNKGLKSALIVAAWDDSEQVTSFTKDHYLGICSYLGFENKGMVLGGGCGTPSMTQNTKYPQAAYELGKNL